MTPMFKVWNIEKKEWIKDDIDAYVFINWMVWKSKTVDNRGEAFIDIKFKYLEKIKIVWANETGNFVEPVL